MKVVAVHVGRDSTDDLFSMGKTMFVALIGVVQWEIALVSRYWTKVYFAVWFLSYALVRTLASPSFETGCMCAVHLYSSHG